MKGERILSVFGQINEKYIEEADSIINRVSTKLQHIIAEFFAAFSSLL